MNNSINYKQKYQELKMKFMESVDSAFRLGFEQGIQQAQQNQAQQQQQEAQALKESQSGAAPGAEGNGSNGSPAGEEQMNNPNGMDASPMQETENPAGSELDQHIAQLEGMLKTENNEGLTATLNGLKSLQKKLVFEAEMKKSSAAIPAIARALHKPAFKIGRQASHNMTDSAKKAVNMQEKIVSDIMKSWTEQEQKASKEIKSILSIENLSKKE